MKCDRVKPRCSRCSRLGHECIYISRRRSSTRVRELENKVNTLEACLERVQTRLDSHIQSFADIQGYPALLDNTSASSLTQSIPRVGDSAFAGTHEALYTNSAFHGSEQDGLDAYQTPGASTSVWHPQVDNVASTPLYASHSGLVMTGKIEDLPADLLYSLADLYFKYANPWCPILGRQSTFDKIFPLPAEDTPQRPLLYAIAALSLRFSNDERITPQFRRNFQTTAYREVLAKALTKPDVLVLQALLLLSLDVSDESDGGPSLAGLTLVARLVVQFNLGASDHPKNRMHHAKDPFHISLLPGARSAFEEEECRRLFWMAYVLDRYAAMIWGASFMINSNEVTAKLPSRYDDFVNINRGEAEEFRSGRNALTHDPKDERLGSFSYHCKFAAFMTQVQELLDTAIDIQSPAEVEKWHMSRWQLDSELNTLVGQLPDEHSNISRLCHSDPTSQVSNWIVLHSAIITSIIRLHSPAACPVRTSAAFESSETAMKRCLNAVNSARGMVQDALESGMTKLLGPLFATGIWVWARFLLIHSSYEGCVVPPNLDPFLAALDDIGDIWKAAKGYATSLRQVCSEIEHLSLPAAASAEGYHPIALMRR